MQQRIYETVIDKNGNYISMDVHYLSENVTDERIAQSGLENIEGNITYYTYKSVWLDNDFQRSVVYHIVNANKLNTFNEAKQFLKQHLPDLYSLISNEQIVKVLNQLRSLVLPCGRLYPNIKHTIFVGNKYD